MIFEFRSKRIYKNRQNLDIERARSFTVRFTLLKKLNFCGKKSLNLLGYVMLFQNFENFGSQDFNHNLAAFTF